MLSLLLSIKSASNNQNLSLFPASHASCGSSSYDMVDLGGIYMAGAFMKWNTYKTDDFEDLLCRKNGGRLTPNLAGVVFVFNFGIHESFDFVCDLLKQNYELLNMNHVPMLLVGLCEGKEQVVMSHEIDDLVNFYRIEYVETIANSSKSVQVVYDALTQVIPFKRMYYDAWIYSRTMLKDKLALAIVNNDVDSLRNGLQGSTVSVSTNIRGNTLIHICALEGNIACATILIQYDPICVDYIDSYGHTPLHIASQLGDVAFVQFLIQNGANIYILDSNGNTAIATSHSTTKSVIRNAQEIYMQNQKLQTPLVIPKNITCLDLSHANLHKIHDIILECSQLVELNLNYNSIVDLSKDFSGLVNLKKLYLYHNKVQTITKELTTIPNLEVLDIRRNRLIYMTPSIDNLQKLTTLLVTHNMLEFLPNQICNLNCLHTLDVYGNPLSALPDNVKPKLGINLVEQQTDLMNYLKNQENEITNRRVKVMVVGNDKSGKS